jgi:hypothetical protein
MMFFLRLLGGGYLYCFIYSFVYQFWYWFMGKLVLPFLVLVPFLVLLFIIILKLEGIALWVLEDGVQGAANTATQQVQLAIILSPPVEYP